MVYPAIFHTGFGIAEPPARLYAGTHSGCYQVPHRQCRCGYPYTCRDARLMVCSLATVSNVTGSAFEHAEQHRAATLAGARFKPCAIADPGKGQYPGPCFLREL